MKRFDRIIVYIAILLLVVLLTSFASFVNIAKILVGLIILAFVIHWKLAPYKANLSPKYFNWFVKAENIINPVLNLLKNTPKIQIGQNFYLDSAPVIICGVLITILIIL